MTGMHADPGPVIGDLRATIRLQQRKLNTLEHLCDTADEAHGAVVPVTMIRAILNGIR